MGTSSRVMAAGVATTGFVGLIGAGLAAPQASAETASGGTVPMSSLFRSCDFTKLNYIAANGYGSATGTITSDGTGVTADVFLMIGKPNTTYQVRLIQGPRSGAQRCDAGDPGVTGGALTVDGNGTGSVTLHAARQSGATNAWVFIEGPPDPGQIRGEYYTSEQVTSIA